MKRRGFIIGWQNRHWTGTYSAYNAGQNDPNIPEGGTGPLPDYLTFAIKGRGYNYDDDVRYNSEVVFVGPTMKSASGYIYRFVIMLRRTSRSDDNFDTYFCICSCNTEGRLTDMGSGRTEWDSAIFSDDDTAGAMLLYHGTLSQYSWDKITSQIPFIQNDAYNFMRYNSEAVYEEIRQKDSTGTITTETLEIKTYNKTYWNAFPLYWEDMTTDVNEIISRAQSLSTYKYWYGGAGQIATTELANSLRASYPSIWTSSYYNKALNDLGQRVGDCSYLVNYAYGIASPGNHGPGTSQYLGRWSKWSGQPKNGMIAWRNGHTGIYYNNTTLELVGINYDYQANPYNPGKWEAILYDPNRQY